MNRPVSRLASPASLPTPEQIVEFPELVPLHALAHGIELTVRSIVAAHPGLGDFEAPYWVLDRSRTRHVAHRLVIAASHLQNQIDEYILYLGRDRQNHRDPLEDDLSF